MDMKNIEEEMVRLASEMSLKDQQIEEDDLNWSYPIEVGEKVGQLGKRQVEKKVD